MMYYYGNGYGFGILSFLLNLLWWVLIIALIIWAIRALRHGRVWYTDTKMPLDILKERYAKGEIDKAEFQEKKKDLEQ